MSSTLAASTALSEIPIMSLSRKRKASDTGDDATVSQGNSGDNNGPLVSVTREGLEEVRRRMATVAEETIRSWGSSVNHGSKRNAKESNCSGGGVTEAGTSSRELVDPATTKYLMRFLAGVMTKAESMCKVTDVKQQQEAEKTMEEILSLYEDMERTTSSLTATRTRVTRLGASTCADSLRISKGIDDRKVAALKASIDRSASHALPQTGGDPLDTGFSGLEAGVLEPKVSMLIGAIAELPGPLKAVLQELPELTSSLATTVQSVEATLGLRESRTEALLAKAPPAQLGTTRGRARGLGDIGRDRGSPPPEVVRANAREARVEQARLERAAAGAGRLGQICSS